MSEMIEIPEDWEIIELGDVLKIETGSKNAEDSSVNGVYPFFTRAEETQKIDTYSYDTEALFIAGEGNFRVKYYNGKFEAHQRTYVLTSKDNSIDLSYLQKAIQPKITRLISTSVGSTVMSLRKPQIAEIDVLSPKKKKEQQKIAEVLNEVDNAISKIEELFEKNKRIKTALMQDLLNYGVDENGKLRSCETHKFKLSELGDIPEEWDCVELIDVCEDFIVPMRDKPKVFKGDIPWCKIEDFNGKYLSTTQSNQFVDEETIRKMNLKVNPIDTVLCSCSAVIGVTAIVKKPLITNQTFIGLVPNSVKLDSSYLYYLLPTYKKRFENLSSGTTIVYISRKQFEQFQIILPAKTEQQKIAQILSSQDEKIEEIKNKLNKLKSLKASLMQDLLSGKVRVTKLMMEENS